MARRSPGAGPRPPRLWMALIRASLPRRDRDLARELALLWAERARARGRRPANRWLARQALGFAFRVLPTRWSPRAIRLPRRAVLDSVLSDARISARSLARSPAFTLTFMLTLAMATGVLATVYGAADWVLLRPVPGVRSAGGLVTLRLGMHGGRGSHVDWRISEPDLATLRERLGSVNQLAAMTPVDVDARVGAAPPRRVAAELVTTDYFRVLGARAFAGRGFDAGDETGAPRTAVVAYEFARGLAENPAAVVGSDVRVNGTLLRVVGVMEPGFRGAELPGRPLLWLPPAAISVVEPSAPPEARADRGFAIWQRMIGRLAPGATPARVEAAANAVIVAERQEFQRHSYAAMIFEFQAYPGVGLDPAVRASARQTLALLMGAAALLLCLAVANLTNLALAHAVRRRGAMAVRVALGATRARMVRGLFVETLMLSACGGAVALLLVMAGSRWFEGTQLSEFGASLQGLHVNARVVGFVTATSFLVTLVAFLRPAALRRWRPLEHLARGGAAGAGGQRFRSALVSLQVALSVVLLVAAMLLGRTVANLQRVDLGFSPARLFTVQADPRLHGYDGARTARMALAVEARLRRTPGVAAAGAVTPAPLRSQYVTASLDRPDDTDRHGLVIGAGYYVTPGFLQALGVQVLAGDRAWRADSGTVVITRSMLRALYPDMPPAAAIGHLVLGRRAEPLRIAAVVADVKLSDLTRDPPPTMFQPLARSPLGEPLSIYVRTAGGAPSSARAAVERVMAGVAPDVPLYDARSARAVVDLQFAAQRIMAVVATTLGVLGIALAAIGLYGVLANVVAASEREIAIRAALGAGPRRIVRHVLARGFIPVAVGMAAGTGGAVAVSRLFASKLFGVPALDPGSYGWGLIATAAIAALAAMPPAYRATRVSVVRMLRAE